MRRIPLRRWLASLLGVLVLVQAGVVPALEGTDAGPIHRFESKHDASCFVGHDHSICVQSAANRSLAAGPVAQVPPVVTIALHAPHAAAPRTSSSPVSGGRPRAPPIG